MQTNDFEQHCAFLVHDTARLIRRRFDQTVRGLGLTQARWRVLGWLERVPGLTQSELAERLDIQKAPLGQTLDRLQAEGWVHREPDAADRRIRRVYLEPDAGPRIRLLREQLQEAETSYLRGFDPDELQELVDALHRLRVWLRHAQGGREAPARADPDTWIEALLDCARLLSRTFDARLAGMGFTRQQWLVLNTVERQEGLRQTELAASTSLGAATVGKLVDALQASAWLERRADPTDRRARHLYLGRRARHVLRATRERFALTHAGFAEAIGAEPHRVLVNRLGWIRHRLLEDLAHAGDAARVIQADS